MNQSRNMLSANQRLAENSINIRTPRSTFNVQHTHTTTFNVGDLIPIDLMEVLPGDTFDSKVSSAVRLQTMIAPPFDDLVLDTYYFFVPARLCWEHWKQFNGESESAWVSDRQYVVPKLVVPQAGDRQIYKDTLLDYFGLPVYQSGKMEINRMPFNAYALIWNEYFRDVNLQDEVLINKGDANLNFSVDDPTKGGKLLKANKLHDYFTSCLPDTQRGKEVTINGLFQDIPVISKTKLSPISEMAPLAFAHTHSSKDFVKDYVYDLSVSPHSSSGNNFGWLGMTSSATKSWDVNNELYPANLWADVNQANEISINQLRLAFATQQLLELDARGGNRYVSMLLNHFGVHCADASLQRPELLCADRYSLDIRQVVQTSETASSPLGTLAATSLTNATGAHYVKSFTEHGFVLGLAVARYTHTYGQGIERMWLRTDRFDYYHPILANIGEQPVYKAEIYNDKTVEDYDKHVFGYQEAWAEYRYKPNYVTSEMRVDDNLSLDSMHFADKYVSVPTLSASWITEDKANIDRVLAVQSGVAHQILADFYFDTKITRVMPVHSVPGLDRM